jgi:hypothetical protein
LPFAREYKVQLEISHHQRGRTLEHSADGCDLIIIILSGKAFFSFFFFPTLANFCRSLIFVAMIFLVKLATAAVLGARAVNALYSIATTGKLC